ncbi:serine protease [Corynebacterium uberis]|uniref:serine protease n=1 Tax=Corynebacterium TaxID=1716 RepID=UPI001D0A0B6D|nr:MULTISPECIES: serine protease [Corynebacterium]MCZ9308378.1 serine protease [Corynebacterium sp. c6VSa_13]UDL74049.1 serine protease [Corynebacterium uberis]UDL75067.1 serine protease [Corynebacterium uberis]UDL77280.1 serine protease [Corynebacterium uberis]UDL79564.1 serine protease [Corynebacterium uberis]
MSHSLSVRALACLLACATVTGALASPAAAAPRKMQMSSSTSIDAGTRSRCSITLISDTLAYSAAHCFAFKAKVGDPVTRAHRVIGHITADGMSQPAGKRIDAVRIALDPDAVTVLSPHEIGDSLALRTGDIVHRTGVSSSSVGPMLDDAAKIVRYRETGDIATRCVDATSRPGDSGSAVLDAQEKVVGILTHGPGDHEYCFAPIDLAEAMS